MISTSHKQTKQIAADFAKTLKGSEFVALEGELGAGKTTFIQGLAEALGVYGPVRSPTYTLMNHYKTKHDKIKEIIHLDFYRLQESSSGTLHITSLLEEFLGRDDIIIIAEWPTKEMTDELPQQTPKRNVQIQIVSETEREIEIQ